MALDQKDIELIERVIYKNADDTAVAIARSFERLEERIDAAKARLNSRLSDIEDKLAPCADYFDEIVVDTKGEE